MKRVTTKDLRNAIELGAIGEFWVIPKNNGYQVTFGVKDGKPMLLGTARNEDRTFKTLDAVRVGISEIRENSSFTFVGK